MFGRGPIPPELLVEFLDGYDGALGYLDQQIDSLLEELERRGLLDNTIVVLTSDHGEHFGEHGLIQHGNSLYLPLLHVPLAVYGPRFVPGGLRIAEPTSLVNVAATITDLAGVAAPMLGGHSLAPLWGPDSLTVPIEDPVAAVDWHDGVSRFPPSTLLGGSLRSVLRDNLHYIRRSDGAEELYDVSRDFLEVHNLVGQPGYRPALLEIRTLLDSATAGRAGPGPRPPGD
jgi:arylsulfatase A-like enzyme